MPLTIEGLYVPSVTPLTDDERLDEAGLERQLDRVIEAGASGIYLLGTSGEGVSLRDDVKWKAVETALACVGDRVPLIACFIDTSTERVMDGVSRLTDLGVHGVATTPPIYYLPHSDDDLLRYYEVVADRSPLPIVIYNIPGTTKVTVSPSVMAQLADHPNIIGVKDSTGNWSHTVDLIEATRGKAFNILPGSHLLAGQGILLGAHGAVMSVANIDPVGCVALVESARTRDIDAMNAAIARVLPIGKVFRHGSQAAVLKAALNSLGICGTQTAHPILPVSPEGRRAIDGMLRQLGLLD